MKTKIIIYDCDGVLFDSRRSNYAFYNHILRQFGMDSMSQEQARQAYVQTSVEALEMLFEGTPHTEQAKKFAKTVVNDDFISLMDIEPNLLETLVQLRVDYRTAIATNRGRSMPQVLEDHKIGHLFDYVVNSEDVEKPKPHPECLIKILTYFKARPQECIYIGDAQIDQEVAQLTDIPFIAYKNPALNAWVHISDHLELLDILNGKHKH